MLKGYRTLFLNAGLAALAGFLHFAAGSETAAALSSHPNILLAVAAVSNFALRFVTNTPVGSK